MILSSEKVVLPRGASDYQIANTFLRAIPEQFRHNISEDMELTVTVETTGKDRVKKFAVERQLVRRIANMGIATWTAYDYAFDFAKWKFCWHGREIHLTASEALYLYRGLVMRDGNRRQNYFLKHARKRLGQDFLMEVTG